MARLVPFAAGEQTRSPHQQKRQGRPPAVLFHRQFQICGYFLLTAFFSSAPGVNFATFRAAILIVAPVCGLRPFRAFLCDTENVPKPISATRSPFRSAPVMLSTAVSIAVVADALFIVSPRRSLSCPAHTGEQQAVPELGNLTVCIFLPPSGLSTVKIRAGSLFCTVAARIVALEADSHVAALPRFRRDPLAGARFSPVFLAHPQLRRSLHRMYTGATGLRLARSSVPSEKSNKALSS